MCYLNFLSNFNYGQRIPTMQNENKATFYNYNSPNLNANDPASCGTNLSSGNEEQTDRPDYTSL